MGLKVPVTTPGREDDQKKVNFDCHVHLALTKHQLKCILLNKKLYIYHFLVLIGERVLPWIYERIWWWVGGVRKFLSLKELRNPYAKMDHPLSHMARMCFSNRCFYIESFPGPL